MIPQGWRAGLHLAHWRAQVCNSDARDHLRVVKNNLRTGHPDKELISGAKKNWYEVDVDFV
jgi:hypothetical protein